MLLKINTRKSKKHQYVCGAFLSIICHCPMGAFLSLDFISMKTTFLDVFRFLCFGVYASRYIPISFSSPGKMKQKILSLPIPTALKPHSYQNPIQLLEMTIHFPSFFLFSSFSYSLVSLKGNPYDNFNSANLKLCTIKTSHLK